jgi:hypothetical protein
MLNVLCTFPAISTIALELRRLYNAKVVRKSVANLAKGCLHDISLCLTIVTVGSTLRFWSIQAYPAFPKYLLSAGYTPIKSKLK